MAFDLFKRVIVAEPLKEVAHYWDTVRRDRPIPAWGDIRPSAIAPHLPILWCWKYDSASDSFTGRLAGDAIEAILGRSLRGASMTDIFGPDHAPIFNRHKRVVTESICFHGTGLVFRHIDRYGTGERIILPLSDTGGPPDGILGATVYETTVGAVPPGLAAVEMEEWYPLA